MEKQEATFVCEVSKPNQTAKWLRNGVEVTSAGRMEIKVDGTRHVLTVKDAEKSDEAQYSVTFADLSSAASLLVTGKFLGCKLGDGSSQIVFSTTIFLLMQE